MAQVWVLDFGSQYTQLITRKTRELGYSCKVLQLKETKELFNRGIFPACLVLSGGPSSVKNDQRDYDFLFQKKGIPLLGICYGMQLMGRYFGGKVEKGRLGEYGHADVFIEKNLSIPDCPSKHQVWMSHSDHISVVPFGFIPFMKSDNGILAAIKHKSDPIVGLQFHPEVEHTSYGKNILQYIYKDLAGLKQDWNDQTILKEVKDSFSAIGEAPILCAFSGGVDSLVAATLAKQMSKIKCFFVDNGLTRPQDHSHINDLKEQTSLDIEVIHAGEWFLDRLKNITDPEEKRKIIGKTFIEVFEEQVHRYEKTHKIKFEYLLQGTLYPDVIESYSPFDGQSVTIKSHHNVGGLPEQMNLKLLEPLRWLFKDEVRKLGLMLGLNREWIFRHPFPGPGIGVRVTGDLTQEKIKKVQISDQILFEELKAQNFYHDCWQAFTVLLPVKTVGIKGDARTYEEVICIRMVNSSDGMTASYTQPPWTLLSKVSSRITNEIRGITRVVYDITGKPPGTIEWE